MNGSPAVPVATERVSAAWMGQDGREWREVSYWNGCGWQTFLQVKVNNEWRGW